MIGFAEGLLVGPSGNLDLFLPASSFGEMRKGLDQLYEEPANAAISIADALGVFARKVKGGHRKNWPTSRRNFEASLILTLSPSRSRSSREPMSSPSCRDCLARFRPALIIEFDHVRGGAFACFSVSVC